MAGLSGNRAWIMAQKQTAKGTVATYAAASAYKNPFSGGNIGVVRQMDNLSETDSSRDQGVTFAQTAGVEGSPEFYARDASLGFYLWAALGADAVTGTNPNYTHTITPANTLPYLTIWKNVGDTLYEQFQDCKVSGLTISADAGNPLKVSANVQGLTSTRLTAAPDNATPKAVESGYAYNFNDATVTLGGSSTALVRSFELSIENNVQRQQTDAFIPYDVYEGQRVVTLSFEMVFENLTEYNKFHYGGAAGTAISSTVFTTSADFQFDNGANNQIKFTLPSIAYTEFPVEPQPNGEPVSVQVSAVAQRNAQPVLTAVVKNQVASY